jgi:hypothetical protein
VRALRPPEGLLQGPVELVLHPVGGRVVELLVGVAEARGTGRQLVDRGGELVEDLGAGLSGGDRHRGSG